MPEPDRVNSVKSGPRRQAAATPPVGFRLRQSRRERGVTQSALAAQVGISASYLNLIEHGKREVAGALLHRIAAALELEIGALTGKESVRLVHDLTELTTEPLLRDLALAPGAAQEIAGRHPEWGRALVRLHRLYSRIGQMVDSLSHGSAVLQSSQELLTRMGSVRSFAEILQEHAIEPDRRMLFTALIAEEAAKLAELARSMFERLSDFGESGRPSTPAEEVDDFLIDRGNHFPEIEERAQALGARIRGAGELDEAALRTWLAGWHDVRVVVSRGTLGPARPARSFFDAAESTFHLAPGLPSATVRFQLARLAFALSDGGLAASSLARDRRLTGKAARERATNALQSYGAAALLFPYEHFREAAERTRYDVDRLAGLFGASFEQVCHRLVTLSRPGAEGIPFAFLRVDPAGNISKRFSLPSLRLPRSGGACPLWAVYATFQAPGATITQRIRLPDRREFLAVARTVAKPAAAFGAPGETYAVMIACEAAHAGRIVYGEAPKASPGLALETGVNCQLCPRDNCGQRAHPQIVRAR